MHAYTVQVSVIIFKSQCLKKEQYVLHVSVQRVIAVEQMVLQVAQNKYELYRNSA